LFQSKGWKNVVIKTKIISFLRYWSTIQIWGGF